MHINTFDHFQSRDSLIHRLDPRVKVVVTVSFILSNALIPDGAWMAFLFSWSMLLITCALSKMSITFLVKRSFIALPFTLAAVSAIFSIPGEQAFILNIGPWELVGTINGLVRFLSILLRSWISVQMAIVMTATTRFPDLVHALRHLKTPQILIATLSFMYRYLFVLSDEAVRLLRARKARSAQARGAHRSGGPLLWRAKVTGNMVGQLFLRSYERSERVYNAMLSRGYDGDLLTFNPHVLDARDWLILFTSLIMLLTLQLIGRF